MLASLLVVPPDVLHDLAAELNEFLVGQRALGPVDLLVQHLNVLDAVLPPTTNRYDVV
jgi:hypothetical protein